MNVILAETAHSAQHSEDTTPANQSAFRRCFLCRSYSLDQATDLCDKCADACVADGAEMLAGLAT